MVHKTKDEARANFEAAITYIPDRYEKGVKKADWLTPAKSDAAEKNYADAVSKAVGNKTRQKKISAMSNEDWKSAAVEKGARIIGDRLRGAMDKWEREFAPMLDAVNAAADALPPKTLDYTANINNRLVPIVKKWKTVSGKA